MRAPRCLGSAAMVSMVSAEAHHAASGRAGLQHLAPSVHGWGEGSAWELLSAFSLDFTGAII
jgi:hypothetical protein